MVVDHTFLAMPIKKHNPTKSKRTKTTKRNGTMDVEAMYSVAVELYVVKARYNIIH